MKNSTIHTEENWPMLTILFTTIFTIVITFIFTIVFTILDIIIYTIIIRQLVCKRCQVQYCLYGSKLDFIY